MRHKLYYQSDDLGLAWLDEFEDCPNLEVVQGDITQAKCDAIVSPANSFGFMDGGLDYAISERFGWSLQERLQKCIQELPEGELLIGKALVVETNNKEVPFLIAAPTMRVPMNFNISTSINAYLAMKAILIAARKHSDISSVAVPGLCTGIGRMPVKFAARQMYTAYSEIELGTQPVFADFGDAQKYHWKLNETGLIYDN